jgi:hypothetical protein
MTILQALTPIYFGIGLLWVIREWRRMLERHETGLMPVPVVLLTGIVIFIVVMATWPVAVVFRLQHYTMFISRWIRDGLIHRGMRRLTLQIVVICTVNVAVQLTIDGPRALATTVWGWAFAYVAARMGYHYGTPRAVLGHFEAVRVEEDGTQTSISGRLLVDSEPPVGKK